MFNVETINAYHEFYRQLQEKARVEGVYRCRINDVKSHGSSKEQRIESLEPILHNKTLVLNDRHTKERGKKEEKEKKEIKKQKEKKKKERKKKRKKERKIR